MPLSSEPFEGFPNSDSMSFSLLTVSHFTNQTEYEFVFLFSVFKHWVCLHSKTILCAKWKIYSNRSAQNSKLIILRIFWLASVCSTSSTSSTLFRNSFLWLTNEQCKQKTLSLRKTNIEKQIVDRDRGRRRWENCRQSPINLLSIQLSLNIALKQKVNIY